MNRIHHYRLFVAISLILLVLSNTFFLISGLFNYALIALGLGLRHGLDADHIIAIDNVTRKLVAENKAAQNTGLFFALGHSTVVFLFTVIIVIGVSHTQGLYTNLREIGDKTGDFISIIFLTFTLILNLILLQSLRDVPIKKMRSSGFIYKIVNQYLFKAIDRPQKMYLVGFFFGLGFDTATEISLLSLTATSLVQGFSLILILLLPLLFTGGMVITDTLNSRFMAHFYRHISQKQHKLKLYNYIILSFASVATIFVISIESFNYLKHSTAATHFIAHAMTELGNNSNIVGVVIVAIFIVLSFFTYNPSVKLKVTTDKQEKFG